MGRFVSNDLEGARIEALAYERPRLSEQELLELDYDDEDPVGYDEE